MASKSPEINDKIRRGKARSTEQSVVLCTDQYDMYNEIEGYNAIDSYLAITHSEHYAVGDAHINSCENRHSFLRNWLRRFRGVSKHHLQGYLNFLSLILNTDGWFEQIIGTDFYI